VVGYYLLPLFDASSTRWLVLRAVASAIVLGLALALVVRTVAHEVRADESELRLDRLLLAAVAGVVVFALADFVIARIDPTQFAGLGTKTDALYFAVTTLATVGFGDVHAEGQFARLVVTVQMVFNLVVLASAARALVRGLAQLSRAGRSEGVLPVDGQAPDDGDVQRDHEQ
jgi:voltage-gated potassium channel